MNCINRREFLKRTTALSLTSMAFIGFSEGVFAAADSNEQLRSFLTGSDQHVSGIALRHKDKLSKIYAERKFVPLWSKNGNFTETCRAVIAQLQNASEVGLHTSQYYTQVLSNWLYLQSSSSATQLELVLTDAVYEYLDNLANGESDEQPGGNSWFAKQSKTDVEHTAMQFFRGIVSFSNTSSQLQPYDQRYSNLIIALNEYNQIQSNGGFTRVASGATLKLGDQDSRVQQLNSRLMESRDLEQYSSSNTYDMQLEAGVKAFQQRHGLEADGAIGSKTLAELNVPVEQRITQIEVNLDRWRWLPQDLGGSNIVVNTAGFEMDVTLNQNHVLTMPVVVGKPKNKTPIFSDSMEHLVFNPSWNVPVSITRKELLPKEQNNPGYLEGRNFVAVSISNNKTYSLSSLSSSELYPANFIAKYRLRQLPGKNNALGSIKFMLPNQYAIYLHDTPAKSLFSRTSRAFSHGCVRVQDPVELAKTLLLNDGMENHSIDTILASNKSKTVNLREHLQVHMTYQTSWVDQFNRVQFRKDIYDHDSQAIQNYQYQRPQQAEKETQVLAQLGQFTTASNDAF